MTSPVSRFMIVGALGFAVQVTAIWLLTSFARWPWPAATIVAVECAIVHNFVWHERWTFRRFNGLQSFSGFRRFNGFSRFTRFVQFNMATGVTSILGNVVLMAALVGVFGLPAVAANGVAVGLMSAANFLVSDRWVFAVAPDARMFCAILALLLLPGRASAGPSSEALNAWTTYVTTTERRLATAPPPDSSARSGSPTAEGQTIDVGDGTISHWRGSVLLRGISLDELLRRLQNPGTPPPQEDIVSSRVVARGADSLRVYMRLVRHAIVTVTYDTEHDMVFRRVSPSLATARSTATRIEEVGGGDHGFLWRLSSYWRYEQLGTGGVLVTLESLTLSRDVPMLIKPIAGRVVPRIARESMVRTLDALKRFAEQTSTTGGHGG